MHERYSQLSLQFADVEGERQKFIMTLKNVRSPRKLTHMKCSSSGTASYGGIRHFWYKENKALLGGSELGIEAEGELGFIFLQQLQPKWSRFMTIIKQQYNLDTVSYHKLFDVLKQYQKEVNEIHAKRIAKNANPLALVVATLPHPNPYYQVPKSHKPYAPTLKQPSSTRSNASTKFKGKEIAKPITPPFESASKEDSDPEQAQRDKDMHKNLALIAKYIKKIYKPTNNNLKTSSNSRNKNVDTSPRFVKDNQTGQFGNQRTVTVAEARETIGNQVVQ
ncbi:hypothetical protein Tco_0536638 [Tanacetum coccineum]